MTLTELKGLAEILKDRMDPEVQLLVNGLFSLLSSQEARIKELEDQIAKNSRNSSKPPSSDNKEKVERKKRGKGRKPGGQEGHPGHQLDLSSEPDEVIRYEVAECPCCKLSLLELEAERVERKQIIDVSLPKRHVVEHQIVLSRCPGCGQLWESSEVPEEVVHRTAYGPGVKAYCSYLHSYHQLPYERISELMKEMADIPLSPGSIVNFQKVAYERLASFEQELKEVLSSSPAIFCDETGMRVKLQNYWMHTVCNDRYSYFHIDPKRGQEAMDRMGILPDYQGVAHHDAWSSYFTYQKPKHSLCNAHLLRELIFLSENHDQQWAQKMIDLLVRIKILVDQSDSGVLTSQWQGRLRKQYRQIIEEGMNLHPPPEKVEGQRGRIAKSKSRNLLERLEKCEDQYLRFMVQPEAQFDNNQAERDLRMNKVKMKISGCFRSERGAKYFARMRSFILTMQKNQNNIIEELIKVFDLKNTGSPVFDF